MNECLTTLQHKNNLAFGCQTNSNFSHLMLIMVSERLCMLVFNITETCSNNQNTICVHLEVWVDQTSGF